VVSWYHTQTQHPTPGGLLSFAQCYAIAVVVRERSVQVLMRATSPPHARICTGDGNARAWQRG
jgi:hypothetical protein